jgi:hypothetical protein
MRKPVEACVAPQPQCLRHGRLGLVNALFCHYRRLLPPPNEERPLLPHDELRLPELLLHDELRFDPLDEPQPELLGALGAVERPLPHEELRLPELLPHDELRLLPLLLPQLALLGALGAVERLEPHEELRLLPELLPQLELLGAFGVPQVDGRLAAPERFWNPRPCPCRSVKLLPELLGAGANLDGTLADGME